MTERLLTTPEDLLKSLLTPFGADDIKQGPAESDGFKPSYVDQSALLKRLENTFDWNLTIRSERIDHATKLAIVVVSIGWKYVVHSGETSHVVETHRDGIGVAPIAVAQNQMSGQLEFVNTGQAMAIALDMAIKKAAKHIGLGRHLWEAPKPAVTTGVQQQQQQQVPLTQADLSTEPAQAFQIKTIVTYFEQTVGYTRDVWMAQLQIQDPNRITWAMADQILREEHPYVQHIVKSTGKRPTGMRTTEAM